MHARMCTRMYRHTGAHARAHTRSHTRRPDAPVQRLPRGDRGGGRARPRHASAPGLPDASAMAPTLSGDKRHSTPARSGHGQRRPGLATPPSPPGDPHFTPRDTVPSLETWPRGQETRDGGGLGRRPPRAGAWRRDLPVPTRLGSVSEDGEGQRTQGDKRGTLRKRWNEGSTAGLCTRDENPRHGCTECIFPKEKM